MKLLVWVLSQNDGEERKACEDTQGECQEDRDWSDASTNQETTVATKSWEKGME